MGSEIRILHTSDIHLDASLRAAGIPSARARERCSAHLEAFDCVVDEAARLDAHMLVIAGDLFEGVQARPSTVRHVARRLEAWARPVFIAPGNHDPICEGSVYTFVEWPANVTVFRGAWESLPLRDLDVVVHGRGFTGPEEADRLFDGLAVDGGGTHVVVAHGSDESSRPDRHQPYRPFTTAELDALPAAYVALGHYHGFAILPTRRVRAVYCGSPIPQGFQDRGEHGVVLARVLHGHTEVELHPLSARRFVTLHVDVGAAETLAEVRERVEHAIAANHAQDDFVRAHLDGALPPDLDVDVAALSLELQQCAYDLELRDETYPEYDVESLANEATVRGQFVRTLFERMQSAPEPERDGIRRALFLGLDAFAGRPQRR